MFAIKKQTVAPTQGRQGLRAKYAMKKNAPTAGWNQPVVADEPHIGVRQKYSAKRAMKKTINQNQGPVTSRKRLLKRHNQPVGKISMFQKVKLGICKKILRIVT